MVISLVVLDELKTLQECPVGLFVSKNDGVLCVKTEYGLESYIVASGERFWGGTDNEKDLSKVEVYPCYSESGSSDLLPEKIEMPAHDGWVTSKHPSYGMLSFSRMNCSAIPLFGSSIKHRNPIRLTISHGSMDRGINNDWYHARGRIIEVEMSQSQFADAITSFNMGDGVPCTIRFTERDGNIPECNFVNKVEQFTQEFSDNLSGVKESLDNCIISVEEILKNKKAPTKAEKEAILNTLKRARQSIGGNANYMCNCFAEQMDKTVKEAKGEIESFMQHRVHTFAANAMLEQANNNSELLTEGIGNPIEVE